MLLLLSCRLCHLRFPFASFFSSKGDGKGERESLERTDVVEDVFHRGEECAPGVEELSFVIYYAFYYAFKGKG